MSASDIAAEHMNLGRWQPDFIEISYSSKKIALWPEESRPSDIRASKIGRGLRSQAIVQPSPSSTSQIYFLLGGQSGFFRGSLGLVVGFMNSQCRLP